VHGIFPQIAVADITTPSPSPAPSAPLAMDYEYNTGFTTAGYRHSGESLLQPVQIPAVVKPHGTFTLLGKLLTIGAEDVEPEWIECTPHFNAASTVYQQCGASGNPAGYTLNYFTGGENTPPYYVGFNFMQHCPTKMPWTTCGATTQFLSLGVGSFLDTYNWGVTTPGVNGANAYWSGSGGPGVAPTQTFEYMDCHFNRYADLAFFFQHFPDLPVLYSGSPSEGVGGWGGTIDSWLGTNGSNNRTNFKNITSFYSATVDPGVDNDINQIYNWDVTLPNGTAINASEPGTNPAYVVDPGYEC
jgi:hypothetical protein